MPSNRWLQTEGVGLVLFLGSSTLKAQAFPVQHRAWMWHSNCLSRSQHMVAGEHFPTAGMINLWQKILNQPCPCFKYLCALTSQKMPFASSTLRHSQASNKKKKAGNKHADNMRLAAILFTYRTDVQLPSHLKSSSRSAQFILSCLCLKRCLCRVESWTYSNSSQHTRQQLFLLYYCA